MDAVTSLSRLVQKASFFTRKDLKNVKSIFRKSNRTTRKKYFLNQIKQGGHFDIGLVFVTVRED